jgi:hypothetical protein
MLSSVMFHQFRIGYRLGPDRIGIYLLIPTLALTLYIDLSGLFQIGHTSYLGEVLRSGFPVGSFLVGSFRALALNRVSALLKIFDWLRT